MEIVLYSKNESGSLFFKKNIEKSGHGCSCVYTLAEMIRTIRGKNPDIVFTDTRDINLFGFDVEAHLEVMEATFAYYDLNEYYFTKKQVPKIQDFLPIIEKYTTFVEIQKYKLKNTIITEMEKKTKKFNEIELSKKTFLREKKLQNHHILLLQYFFQNLNINLSSNELMKLLWNKKKNKKQENSNEGQEHLNTFYSYISQIKQFLLKNDMEVEIFRTSKGFYSCSIKD